MADHDDPYKMAVLQGRVVEVRPNHDCKVMDRIAMKYISKPFPARGPDRIAVVVAADKAGHRTLDGLEHRPERQERW